MFLTSFCAQGAAAVPLALLQQPGQESPFKDLLGWIIVFFVVVWPIIRGMLDSARGQRKEFDAKQSKAKPTPKKRRGRTLEEILEGKLERAHPLSVEPDEPIVEAKATPPKRRKKRVTKAPAFGDRPADESSAPVYGDDDLFSDNTAGSELVGDPFDESSMERDLVPDAKLRHVPSEDRIEAGISTGGIDDPAARSTTLGAMPSVLAPGPNPAPGTSIHDDPEVMFRRAGRELSPWQRAFILKEVLGEPLASRPTPSLIDSPD